METLQKCQSLPDVFKSTGKISRIPIVRAKYNILASEVKSDASLRGSGGCMGLFLLVLLMRSLEHNKHNDTHLFRQVE